MVAATPDWQSCQNEWSKINILLSACITNPDNDALPISAMSRKSLDIHCSSRWPSSRWRADRKPVKGSWHYSPNEILKGHPPSFSLLAAFLVVRATSFKQNPWNPSTNHIRTTPTMTILCTKTLHEGENVNLKSTVLQSRLPSDVFFATQSALKLWYLWDSYWELSKGADNYQLIIDILSLWSSRIFCRFFFPLIKLYTVSLKHRKRTVAKFVYSRSISKPGKPVQCYEGIFLLMF